jgi:outer membrane protein insertion porin family
MFKTFLIIVFIIFHTISLKAEIVKKIEISGNTRVTNETIQIYGDIKINNDYTEQDLNKVLDNLYSTNFFQDVKVELTNGILKIFLDEYPIINQLIFIGEPSKKYTEQITKIIQLKQKDSFIKNYLATDIEKIRQLYSSAGYNFVKIETKIRKIDNKNLDLVFEIERGNQTKISKIIFTGDKKVREKRLRDVIASEEDKFYKFISKNTKFSKILVNLDLRLLENYYKSIGYYDVKITSKSAEVKESGNIDLTYSIDAGNRYIIKKITTNADSVFDKNIFFPLNKKYNKYIGEYYSPFKIKDLLEEIDELIENNNLQFVEHNVEEIVEEDSLIIKFNIFEGDKVLVERINILGNNVTNESVVRGELLLDEGDPFTTLALDKSISKIKSRGIFRSVKPNVSNGSSANLKVIDITVEEQPTGEVAAGAGLGTNGGALAFNIKENNWLGEGKKIAFNVDLDKESLKGEMIYTNPNYDFLGNSLNYAISSSQNSKPDRGFENNIYSAGVSTSFEQYKDLYATFGIAATHDDLRTQADASDTLKKQHGAFSEITGNYGFSVDKRNRSFMPTDGSILSFNQGLPIYADKPTLVNKFAASFYQAINENIVSAAKFNLTTVTGLADEDVRLSKRTNVNTSRLRGFKRGKVGPIDGGDHVGGNYAASINLEASLPKLLPESTKTDIGLFLDFGNVWGVDYDSSIDSSNKIRSSTGVAASWISPMGPMTFVFATNLSKASSDVTEGFNFNLGTTF